MNQAKELQVGRHFPSQSLQSLLSFLLLCFHLINNKINNKKNNKNN